MGHRLPRVTRLRGWARREHVHRAHSARQVRQRQASQQLRPFSTTGTVLALGLGTRAFCAAVLGRERTSANNRGRLFFSPPLAAPAARANNFVTSHDKTMDSVAANSPKDTKDDETTPPLKLQP